MGFWSETCAMSGLPIQVGDECVLVAVKDYDQMHMPLLGVLSIERGEYGDYGNIDEQDSCESGFFMHARMWQWALEYHEHYFEPIDPDRQLIVSNYVNLLPSNNAMGTCLYKYKDLPKELQELFVVYLVGTRARRDFMAGEMSRGSQSVYMDLHLSLLEESLGLAATLPWDDNDSE
jgi:hypothetical protein